MITCPLCNYSFRQLTNTHLLNSHNMSIKEFRSIYPFFLFWSTETELQKQKSSVITRQELEKKYYNNPFKCKKCNKIIPFEKKFNIFCNRKCSGSYNTIGKHHSQETKNKIRETMNNSIKMNGPYQQSRTFVIRSKNEIKLFEMLNIKFKCLHNVKMFNGRDADIIIPSLKLAILWNGIWHYEQVIKNRSLLQMKNIDDYKLRQIIKCGYNFIIIKDHNNKMTPEKGYQRILECIEKNTFNLTIIN